MSPDPALVGKYHNQRAVFAVHNADGIHISNLSLRSSRRCTGAGRSLIDTGERSDRE